MVITIIYNICFRSLPFFLAFLFLTECTISSKRPVGYIKADTVEYKVKTGSKNPEPKIVQLGIPEKTVVSEGQQDTLVDAVTMSMITFDTVFYDNSEKLTVLPEFPCPPPEPSGAVDLSEAFLHQEIIKLKNIDKALRAVLDEHGYSRKSYYHFPLGFALVTELEQIDKDGYSAQKERWVVSEAKLQARKFTIKDYIYQLFNSKPGYYRCLVFIVSGKNYTLSGSPAISQKEVQGWLSAGFNRLPKEIGNIQVNYSEDNISVEALIYEFKKLENEEFATLIIPGTISGEEHLEHSGIILNH
jgi:hypothetical protein